MHGGTPDRVSPHLLERLGIVSLPWRACRHPIRLEARRIEGRHCERHPNGIELLIVTGVSQEKIGSSVRHGLLRFIWCGQIRKGGACLA